MVNLINPDAVAAERDTNEACEHGDRNQSRFLRHANHNPPAMPTIHPGKVAIPSGPVLTKVARYCFSNGAEASPPKAAPG